ncbi:MAG: DNA polymerase III subunit beta [Ignavibacteria bacterium]
MKFSISLGDFQKAMQRVLPAIPPRSTLPVLEHVHCTASKSGLDLIASDQEMTISTHVPCMVEEQGTVLIPARKLHDLLRSLGQEGALLIDINANLDITFKTSGGSFTMKGMDSEDYPQQPVFPEGEHALLSAADAMKIANRTMFAVSDDEYRPAMTGVLFQFRGNHVVGVSTDSYRLARVIVRGEHFPDDLDVIIPSRAMDVLRKVDSNVDMSVTRTHARFAMSDTTVITRIIDERFPPYENVIPVDNDKIAIVNQKDLAGVIKRVALFTSSTSRQIKITLTPNRVHVHGEDDETGSNADESTACEFSGSDAFEIGFNHRYLEEALQQLSGDESGMVRLSFSSPNRAVLIEPTSENSDILILVMPVRLS